MVLWTDWEVILPVGGTDCVCGLSATEARRDEDFHVSLAAVVSG